MTQTTPMTDAASARFADATSQAATLANLARRLERDRAALIAALDALVCECDRNLVLGNSKVLANARLAVGGTKGFWINPELKVKS